MLKTDKEKKAEEEGAYKSFGGGIYRTKWTNKLMK